MRFKNRVRKFLLHKGLDALEIGRLIRESGPRKALERAKSKYGFEITEDNRDKFDLDDSSHSQST